MDNRIGQAVITTMITLMLLVVAAVESQAELTRPPQDDLARQPTDSGVSNGSFEAWRSDRPLNWHIVSPTGTEVRRDDSQPHQGTIAALIDATQESITGNSFSNLMQSISAEPYQGKTVRLRAAIKTSQLDDSSRVQMWLRVDRKREANHPADAMPPVGAFDNMSDRPIRSEIYTNFEIVLPVAEDAASLAFGIFLIGRGRAWIDDVSLVIVDATSNLTPKPKAEPTSRFQIPPRVREAFQAAEAAPPQPFFTNWLWLPLIAMSLFFLAMAGPMPPDRNLVDVNVAVRKSSLLSAFAIRFTASYWLLYIFPSMLSNLASFSEELLVPLSGGYSWLESALSHWLAATLLGINGELIPPNGSGDTTYNYLLVLGLFLISLIVASVWTLMDRRASEHANMRDLLRSWLRYGIAFAMIGYGLAKVSFDGNQFPPNSTFQLDKTWGNSSPMNVLWAFMGASQAYTIFAGLGEVVAGLLIVWRRTCLLGAIMALGVMTNVMMLNFCYDVPVKLYSSHLVVMSIMVLVPDIIRLANLFILNRPTDTAVLGGAWQSRWAWWTRLILKSLVVGGLVLLPVGTRVVILPNQWQTKVESTNQSELEKYRLTKRGFRWISEVPFNR